MIYRDLLINKMEISDRIDRIRSRTANPEVGQVHKS
jgi:hypothetical protein